jgi:glucosamine--fructose-6-phosphate aminotransferase (isomerizing)
VLTRIWDGLTTSDKELKYVLVKRGYHFHTETDTEIVAVLCKYVWDSQPHKRLSFTELIKAVVKELVSFDVGSKADI